MEVLFAAWLHALCGWKLGSDIHGRPSTRNFRLDKKSVHFCGEIVFVGGKVVYFVLRQISVSNFACGEKWQIKYVFSSKNEF